MDFLILNENDSYNMNNITNFMKPSEKFDKFNIIPNVKEDKKLKYNEQKLIIYKRKINTDNTLANRIDFDFKFTFTIPFKDVLSVKLLKASLKIKEDNTFSIGTGDNDNGTSGADASAFHYYTLNIDELDCLKSDNSNALNTNSTDSGKLNKFNDAFAVLNVENAFDNGETQGSYANHYNIYENSEIIKYFDPPLHELKEFNIKLFPHNYSHIVNRGKDTFLLLEFLIKTADEITVY
jgi:hypothetical protein|tara:strand:- start:4778 stop:5488 length:711 start_codon:yes stop_codon:yes gene_type:complete